MGERLTIERLAGFYEADDLGAALSAAEPLMASEPPLFVGRRLIGWHHMVPVFEVEALPLECMHGG